MTAPPATHPKRTIVFWMATALIAVDTLLFTMVVPALPEFAERDGLSDAQAALVFATFPVAQLVTALATAGLVERLGRRPLVVAATLLLAGATLMFAVTEGGAMLALARTAQGVAAGAAWTAGIAAISDVFPTRELGLRIGLAQTAGGGLGLLGPVLGGVLIDLVGTDATFLLAAALPMALLPPALMMPETRRPGARPIPVASGIRAVMARRRARAAAGTLAAVSGSLALIEPLVPLELESRLGLSASAIGVVFGACLLGNMIAAPIAGRWSDRSGRIAPVAVGGAVLTASLPLIAVGPAAWVALALLVMGLGFGTMGASCGALLTEAVDEAGLAGNYGLSAAILTVVYSAGYAAGPLVGAAAVAATSFAGAMIAGAALVGATAVWAVAGLRATATDPPLTPPGDALAPRPRGSARPR
jgi:MFS transporter, DHA1 family, solute carrier family 18 (vesicular amine transporter), member 1/2